MIGTSRPHVHVRHPHPGGYRSWLSAGSPRRCSRRQPTSVSAVTDETASRYNLPVNSAVSYLTKIIGAN